MTIKKKYAIFACSLLAPVDIYWPKSGLFRDKEALMRYFIQILGMMSSIVVIAAAALVLYEDPSSIIHWITAGLILWIWYDQGGFEAWNPRVIKEFLQNAKRLGL